MRRPVGVKQIRSCFSQTSFFSRRVSHCRHASIRTLEERIISLGAGWAFSLQPVLPSVRRPLVSLKSGTWLRRLTQSPELGFGLFVFSLPGTILTFFLLFCSYAAAASFARLLLCNGS